MKWLKPWRDKKNSKQNVEERQINSVTTRIIPTSAWADKGIAPLNTEVRVKPGKKSYYDTYKNVMFNDGYYDDTLYPTHGQTANNATVGGTFLWKNGKRVRDHKAIENKSTYTKPEVKKAYAWSESRWSNYSFGNYNYGYKSPDDDSRLFIKEPESYITPTADEIKVKILVYDTIHTDAVKNLCRLFYFKMLDNNDYVMPDIQTTMGSEEYSKQIDFFESAYDGFVPGFTPLEQAVNYYQAVLDKQRAANKSTGNGSGTDTIAFKREDFANPHLNQQMKWNELNQKVPIQILNKVSIIGQLGYQFQVEKEVGEREVHNSDTYRVKPMTSYSQLDRVAIYQKVLPTYRHKFLTKALQVNVPVDTSEKKQKIIILLDYSGSMRSDKKQDWANAILADRLRYVMAGEAEVFFSYFVDSISGLKFHHLKNAKDVEKFWKTFSNFPSGGNTDIGRIVQYIADEVKAGKKLHNLKDLNLSHEKPEILIINDGQDSVNSQKFPYKVNAISLMQFSDQLKNLCIKTGGKQVQISEDQSIRTYSSDGSAVLQQ